MIWLLNIANKKNNHMIDLVGELEPLKPMKQACLCQWVYFKHAKSASNV